MERWFKTLMGGERTDLFLLQATCLRNFSELNVRTASAMHPEHDGVGPEFGPAGAAEDHAAAASISQVVGTTLREAAGRTCGIESTGKT